MLANLCTFRLQSHEGGESGHGGARAGRISVGIDVCVRRLSRGRVGASRTVLRDHGLVVRLSLCGGTLVVAKRRAEGFKAFGLPLPGVVVGGVAHVVVDEGVFGLLVLIVAVC